MQNKFVFTFTFAFWAVVRGFCPKRVKGGKEVQVNSEQVRLESVAEAGERHVVQRRARAEA